MHPASSTSSLGPPTHTASLGSHNIVTSSVLRSRGSLGPGDRSNRRPISLAENATNSPAGNGSFKTLPTTKENKKKKLGSPQSLLPEESPDQYSPTAEASPTGNPFPFYRARGQSEGPCSPVHSSQSNPMTFPSDVNVIPPLPFDHGPIDSTAPSGHYLGRNFNDDSDDEAIGEEISGLSSRFQSAAVVLASPSLCSVLINYLLAQNRDLAPTLFYLVAKHYQWILMHNKDLSKESRRLYYEIYTTFLHRKSPLPVKIDDEVLNKMDDGSPAAFDGCCECVLTHIQPHIENLNRNIRYGLDTWKTIDNFDLTIPHTQEEEINFFDLSLSPCIADLQRFLTNRSVVPSLSTGQSMNTSLTAAAPSSLSTVASLTWLFTTAKVTGFPREQITDALLTSLVTARRYFASVGTTSNSPSSGSPADPLESGNVEDASAATPVTPYSFRKSIFGKSIENLTSVAANTGSSGNAGQTNLNSQGLSGSISGNLDSTGTANWQKLHSFNSKLKSKNFFGTWKSKIQYTQKGHSLQDRSVDKVVECSVCGELLWGLAPQGLTCQYCEVYVHAKCKSLLKEVCSKENKTKGSTSNLSTSSNSNQLNNPRSSLTNPPTSTPNSTPCQQTPLSPDQFPPSAGNFTAPLEDEDAVGLSASTEDIYHSRTSSYSEKLNSSANPMETSLTMSPPGGESSPLQRSTGESGTEYRSSGLSHSHSVSYRDAVPPGLTSPEPSYRHKRGFRQKQDSHSNISSFGSLKKHVGGSMLQLPSGSTDFRRSYGNSTSDLVTELVPWGDDPDMTAVETFDAGIELKIHFPDYQIPTKGPRVDDHVRTLVLLEFHQKVRYMVRYLKQFDYLLLKRWPVEHEKLKLLMCLDKIPILVDLFRDLVAAIETTLQPQGYGLMAEAVLNWLSKNDEANLKSWMWHCQSLSCTNMLESIKSYVREYARKHPDIQKLLDTRFNKFVLIEGLSQVRVLYFNLPLITNNIIKGLDKKTSKHKAEIKTWIKIQSKLDSIPYSIDNVCMPLVKLINNDKFSSTVDKRDQLTRYQNEGNVVQFAELMLEFPRTLFRYWVIDHAEVTLEEYRSTLGNYKERTEVMAILLKDSLMLLVKDGDRYILRPFKPSKTGSITDSNTPSLASSAPSTTNTLGNTDKLLPVFSTANVHIPFGDLEKCALSIVFMETTVLLQLTFAKKEIRECWYQQLKKRNEASIYLKRTNSSIEANSSRKRGCTDISHSRESSKELEGVDTVVPTSESRVETSSDVFQSSSMLTENEEAGNEENPSPIDSNDEPPPPPTLDDLPVSNLIESMSHVQEDIDTLLRSIGDSDDELLGKLPQPVEDMNEAHLLGRQLKLTKAWLSMIENGMGNIFKIPKLERTKNKKKNKAQVKEKEQNEETEKVTTTEEAVQKGHQRSKSAMMTPIVSPVAKAEQKTRCNSAKESDIRRILSTTESHDDENQAGFDDKNARLKQIYELQGLINALASNTEEFIRVKIRKPADIESENSYQTSSHGDSKEDQEEIEQADEEASEDIEKKPVNDASAPCAAPLVEEVSREHPAESTPSNEVLLEGSEKNIVLEDNLDLPNIALDLTDEIIDIASKEFEAHLEAYSAELVKEVIQAVCQSLAEKILETAPIHCPTDSGIELLIGAEHHVSSGDDDELTVRENKEDEAPIASASASVLPDSLSDCDLSEFLPASGVPERKEHCITVGRNDSTKSTTSSGYLGSGDEIMQHES